MVGKNKKNNKVFPEQENEESGSEGNNTIPTENVPPPQNPKKTKSLLARFLPSIYKMLNRKLTPRTTVMENAQQLKFKKIIQDAHDKHIKKKETKRIKREEKKAQGKDKPGRRRTILSKLGLHEYKPSNKFVMKGSDGVTRTLDRDPSISSLPRMTTDSLHSMLSADEAHYLRYLQHHQSGPTHVSALSDTAEHNKRMERRQRRRISHLYEGDEVYHHSLSRYYDHDGSFFHTLLDVEKRKKYPITPEIQVKMDKIQTARDKKASRAATKNCCLIGCVNIFRRTNLGQVFRHTPRYYRLTPEIPKLCRRCRYTLEDTLETRWTPIGITFALLFPIIGILCCIVNREFVCVVCEEIYVYGDYPPRCKPFDKDEDHDFIKMRSLGRVDKSESLRKVELKSRHNE